MSKFTSCARCKVYFETIIQSTAQKHIVLLYYGFSLYLDPLCRVDQMLSLGKLTTPLISIHTLALIRVHNILICHISSWQCLGRYKIGNTEAATNLWIALLPIWIYESIRAYHNNKNTNCWCVNRGLSYQELQLLRYSCILNIELYIIGLYWGKYFILAGAIIQKTYI